MNLLCPVDFSKCSRHALTVASELAARSDATLTLTHVWEQPLYNGPEYPLSGEVIGDIVDETTRAIADWVASATAAGVKTVHSRVVTGVAWNEIVRILEADRTFDLVVMGTHGRSWIKHALVGSVAEKVVRHAPCAVLVVR